MADEERNPEIEEAPRFGLSRRGFIKGVIASGAAAYSASYLFRSPDGVSAQSAAGSVERLMTLNVNGRDRQKVVLIRLAQTQYDDLFATEHNDPAQSIALDL